MKDILRRYDPHIFIGVPKLVTEFIKDHEEIQCFLQVIANDYITAVHSLNVTALTTSYCFFENMSEPMTYVYCLGALLHDVGKVKINKDILCAKRILSDKEFNEIKIHPEIGYNIVLGWGIDNIIADVVYEHHEKLDGSGYPQGLKGNEISHIAQVIGMIDHYEALTNWTRPYRKYGVNSEAALDSIAKDVNKDKYNAEIFHQFKESLQ